MNGPGIIEQARIRPVISTVPQNVPVATQALGQGIGISYGAGTGYVRLTGIKWSLIDLSGQYSFAALNSWRIRIAALAGDYSPGALAFTPQTDLTSWDPILDQPIEGPASGELATWYTPAVTDEGQALTVMVSQVFWTGAGGPPLGITPVVRLHVLGDYAKHFRGGPLNE